MYPSVPSCNLLYPLVPSRTLLYSLGKSVLYCLSGQVLRPNMGAWRALGHADALNSIADRIVEALHWDFDSVHVRRGDKLNPEFWPHLDWDTRGEQ